MNEPELEISQFGTQVTQAAHRFAYPRTPALRPFVSDRPRRVRRLALASLIVLVVLAGVLAVPPIRAAVLRVLRLGAVRVIVPDASPDPLTTPSVAITPTSTSTTPLPPHALLNFGGQTTLAQAQQQLSFAIQLPTYPPDLGAPDAIYLQNDFDKNEVLILVWTRGRLQAQVHLSLHIAHSAADNPIYTKLAPRLIQETTVNGRRALWVEGPYLVQLRNGDFDARYLITGRALIWTEGKSDGAITYRLETALPLDEAIRVAESLQPTAAP